MVVVVRDGQVLLQKGYGVADIRSRLPVDPARTLFRVGSISKLFVGEAVMQLAEEGRLDLDRDVANYLDFALPARNDGPVTLRHLLTHRAGFEDVLKDLIILNPEKAQSLQEYLKKHIPRRVRAAGSVPAYSNYGVSLAAYVVERISGTPFEDFVDRRILQPLGMTRSTFTQPLPDSFAPDLSSGYVDPRDGRRPFTIYGPAPAGALSTTGSDIARFMMARLVDERITPSFLEYDRNGRRIVGHDGGDPVFRSNLRLFPDERVGLFVSFNTIGPTGGVFRVRSELIEQFIDRYFPGTPVEQTATSTANEHARAAAGRYESSDFKGSFFRVLRVLDQVIVRDNGDGTITYAGTLWREVDPWVWREVGGQATLTMTVSAGRVARIARSSDPTSVLIPAPWYRSSAYLLPLLLGSVVVLSAGVMTWRGAGLRWPSRVVALLDVVFLGGWLLLFQQLGAGHAEIFSGGFDPVLRVLQVIGLIGAAGSVVVASEAVQAWRSRDPWTRRMLCTVVALAAAGSAWFGIVSGLLSQSLRY